MRSVAWLKRYKAFRELQERAEWLSDQLDTRTADLEQAQEELEWERAGRRYEEQRAARVKP